MKPTPLHVTIVSANGETLDGLQTYLRQAGVDARGRREIGSSPAEEPASAVVFFPDEFEMVDVVREVIRLGQAQPKTLCVIVTREARRFAEALNDDESALAPVVIPKPAWGWTILDAIRGRLETPA